MKKPFELHPERLATTDEQGHRIYLFVAEVKGFFRDWRLRVQFVLIIFFLILPWIKIGGRQALLLDISRRQFEIFGLSLRAHNAPLLIFVFAAAGFALFFVTAVWGRVWCGWACPQTVFIDGVYRKIETWTEGSAIERRRLSQAPWSANKIFKRTLKWTLYLLATMVITHSLLAYFVGTDRLTTMILRPPTENWGSFLFIVLSTAAVLFDFAWFREQFCIIACPYGRFQSVLMDDKSMVVAYDRNRGEPKATAQAKALSKAHGSRLGDCVDCYRCVQVCPVGIDIRRGVQMECIACTACIDVCDEVMTKVGKPTGLIGYKKPKRSVGWRASAYLALSVLSLVALGLALARLQPVDVTVLRAKGAPYTVQEAGPTILNHLKIELSNQSGSLRHLYFETEDTLVQEGLQLVTAHRPLPLPDGQVLRADLFIRFPKHLLNNGARKIRLFIHEKDMVEGIETVIEKEVTLVGPFS